MMKNCSTPGKAPLSCQEGIRGTFRKTGGTHSALRVDVPETVPEYAGICRFIRDCEGICCRGVCRIQDARGRTKRCGEPCRPGVRPVFSPGSFQEFQELLRRDEENRRGSSQQAVPPLSSPPRQRVRRPDPRFQRGSKDRFP